MFTNPFYFANLSKLETYGDISFEYSAYEKDHALNLTPRQLLIAPTPPNQASNRKLCDQRIQKKELEKENMLEQEKEKEKEKGYEQEKQREQERVNGFNWQPNFYTHQSLSSEKTSTETFFNNYNYFPEFENEGFLSGGTNFVCGLDLDNDLFLKKTVLDQKVPQPNYSTKNSIETDSFMIERNPFEQSNWLAGNQSFSIQFDQPEKIPTYHIFQNSTSHNNAQYQLGEAKSNRKNQNDSSLLLGDFTDLSNNKSDCRLVTNKERSEINKNAKIEKHLLDILTTSYLNEIPGEQSQSVHSSHTNIVVSQRQSDKKIPNNERQKKQTQKKKRDYKNLHKMESLEYIKQKIRVQNKNKNNMRTKNTRRKKCKSKKFILSDEDWEDWDELGEWELSCQKKRARSNRKRERPLATNNKYPNFKKTKSLKKKTTKKKKNSINKIHANEIDWQRRTWQFVFGPKKRLTILKRQRKTRGERLRTSQDAKTIFEKWFNEHINDPAGPYPNQETRQWMSEKTQIPQLQIQRWYGQRRRLQRIHWQNGKAPRPNWI
ncbi:hypothetical protein M0812_15803 [Anaeramoeba flamelloides]|uniref:Homeobox domain-containing protein n=1 Tax=Anaeramoeba flamelloides TaxID=1746091 RepID=A0AAV7ZIW9_9EUKA|nr:hypothetical protein M0812_15803 [Anaeramoeba flamelloides]